MDQCPVCNARYSGTGECRRCKADLSLLLKVEAQANAHLAEAAEARAKGDYPEMLRHARRAVSLKSSRKALGLCCEAAVFTRDFSLAGWCMTQMNG